MKTKIGKSLFGAVLVGAMASAWAYGTVGSPTYQNAGAHSHLLIALDDSATKSGSAGQYIDDAAVTVKVKTALARDKTTKAHEIKVETTKGVVMLSGDVSSSNEIDRAAEVARSVSGVQSVENDLKLKN